MNDKTKQNKNLKSKDLYVRRAAVALGGLTDEQHAAQCVGTQTAV